MVWSSHDGRGFVYTEASKALDQQMGWIDALDNKAGVLLATNGVLVGLTVTSNILSEAHPAVAALLVCLVLLSLIASALSFATRNYEIAPRVEDLADSMDTSTESQLRDGALASIIEALAVNEPKVDQKARFLSAAGALLLVGAVLFGGNFIYWLLK